MTSQWLLNMSIEVLYFPPKKLYPPPKKQISSYAPAVMVLHTDLRGNYAKR